MKTIKDKIKTITPKTFLVNFEEILASLLFSVTLLLVVLNVSARYIFKTGIPWSEEFAMGCFVWTAFIGSAACYKHRQHMGVDVIIKRLPNKAQDAVKLTVDILLTILCCYMFYIGCIYILRSYRKPTAILGISSAVFSVSLPIAFFDMAVWSIVFVIQDIKSMIKGAEPSSDDDMNARKEAEV